MKLKLLKKKFKKFLKKNKKLVNFVVKFFLVLKFVLDVLDLVFKLKDLCPWLGSLIEHVVQCLLGCLAKYLNRPLALTG